MTQAGHKRTSSEAPLHFCEVPTAARSTGAESRTVGAKGGGTEGVEGRR